jgi:5-methylcytosine-specific restriction endonuclease McrA
MIDRLAVYNKYNGHCAYCGRSIKIEEMQIDHVVRLSPKYYHNNGKKYSLKQAIQTFARDWQTNEIVAEDEQDVRNDYKKNNFIENLMPTCYGCNHYKGKWDLEFYRELIKKLHIKMEDEYLIKRGLEYNIVTINPWDGLFYFEKLKDEVKK